MPDEGAGTGLAVAGNDIAGQIHGPRCPGCNGWGSLRSKRKKEFFIPAGAEEGMHAAIDAMSSGEVIIFSLPHPHFRRDPWRQRDLHADVSLTFREAGTGYKYRF
jgi:DnaJ-class molecular chaperone